MSIKFPALPSVLAAACLTLAPVGVAHGQSTAGNRDTENMRPPSQWRWQGKVDESAFRKGGEGVTLHVDYNSPQASDAQTDASGTPECPYKTLATAVERAKRLMASLRSDYRTVDGVDVSSSATPVWLRIERRGNRVSAAVAPDNNGSPGAWRAAGDPVEIALPRRAYIGFAVNNGRGNGWEQNPKNAVTVSGARVNGKPVKQDTWQAATLGVHQHTWPLNRFEAKPGGDGALSISGTGADQTRSGDNAVFVDGAYFVHIPLDGDGSFVARVDGQTLPGGKGFAGISLRESLEGGARRAVLGIENGSTLRFGTRRDLQKGRPVKIVLHPGIHRVTKRADLTDLDQVARGKGFVLEGMTTRRQNAPVVLRASSVAGWEAAIVKGLADPRKSYTGPRGNQPVFGGRADSRPGAKKPDPHASGGEKGKELTREPGDGRLRSRPASAGRRYSRAGSGKRCSGGSDGTR
jgi:hypothetical protein